MNIPKFKIALLAFAFVLLSVLPSFSGASLNVPTSLRADRTLIGFFDLRDRETFIQVTNVVSDPTGNNIHIQIFDVSNNCNENNFFDFYTPFDTHVYNLRDIITNDGNPSGVILPDGAYGAFMVVGEGEDGPDSKEIIGNLRMLDDNGYEYRTNLLGEDADGSFPIINDDADQFITFNFNTKGGVTLSDFIGIPFNDDADTQDLTTADILNIYQSFFVDIYDLNENAFSCRNVAFACVTEEHPLYEELLEEIENDGGSSNVANFEYGINNVIPHSKGGELLCPGNTISEGFVRFELDEDGSNVEDDAIYFIGLNNGNGRGSIDSVWLQNTKTPFPGGGGGLG